jgi:glycosyltransferase involved in cell wall biosynthesis
MGHLTKARRVAYFINQYPKVSHSFIRREISALERLGLKVERFAARNYPGELVDRLDRIEHEKTCCLLAMPAWALILATAKMFFSRPLKFTRTLLISISMGWKSERGIPTHIGYLIEACILERLLRKQEIKHVHAHFGTNSASVVMLVNNLGGPSYSFTVHGPEEFDKPEFLSLNRKIRNAKFIVAISSYTRGQLYRWMDHAEWRKIEVIHCGLELKNYNTADFTKFDSKNFVCIGRLCEQKGQTLLVDAIAKLVSEGHEVYLTLAGDGPMRKVIEELIVQYNLQSYITITGWISGDQVMEEILRARALVLPSFAEGLPVVLMEAMANGRPVVSTYIAGIPELVEPGKNGWLIQSGDCASLTKTLAEVLDTEDKELERLGANGREKVFRSHNIDVEAKKLLFLFDRYI